MHGSDEVGLPLRASGAPARLQHHQSAGVVQPWRDRTALTCWARTRHMPLRADRANGAHRRAGTRHAALPVMRKQRMPTRMPNPRKPFIELTRRNQTLAAVGILCGSYLLSNVFIHNAPPQQAREFTTNFDPAAIVAAPKQQPAPGTHGAPTVETEMFVMPESMPAVADLSDRRSL